MPKDSCERFFHRDPDWTGYCVDCGKDHEEIAEENSFKGWLTNLLSLAYDKGQAYYRKDFFGASEDEDQEWDDYY